MTKKAPTPRTKLSISQLQALIRKEAIDSINISFTPHVRVRMRERNITDACVLAVLRKGVIRRRPEPNAAKGSLECRMENFVAGQDVGIVVAISDEYPDLLVVTAMWL